MTWARNLAAPFIREAFDPRSPPEHRSIRVDDPPDVPADGSNTGWLLCGPIDSARRRSMWARLWFIEPSAEKMDLTLPQNIYRIDLRAGREGDDDWCTIYRSAAQFLGLLGVIQTAIWIDTIGIDVAMSLPYSLLMTTTQISKKAARAMTKFDLAKQIRDLLDAAKKAYGPTDWTDEDMEGQILELVTEEG